MEWEPLPQRRNVSRRKRGTEDASETESRVPNATQQRTMEDNVEARRVAKKALNTLDSTDGCAGEV